MSCGSLIWIRETARWQPLGIFFSFFPPKISKKTSLAADLEKKKEIPSDVILAIQGNFVTMYWKYRLTANKRGCGILTSVSQLVPIYQRSLQGPQLITTMGGL